MPSRSVDHPRFVDADEADIFAIAALHAGDVRKASPAGAMVGRHVPVNVLDRRRIGNDAAGVVAIDPWITVEETGIGRPAGAKRDQSRHHHNSTTHRNALRRNRTIKPSLKTCAMKRKCADLWGQAQIPQAAASGADLTFATHPAANSVANVKSKSSTSTYSC